jgi:hypothetical protein
MMHVQLPRRLLIFMAGFVIEITVAPTTMRRRK